MFARTCGSVALALPVTLLDPTVAEGAYKRELDARFWPVYSPPLEEVDDLGAAIRGERDWAGRQVTLRAEWKLWRVESPATPWVFLLSDDARYVTGQTVPVEGGATIA